MMLRILFAIIIIVLCMCCIGKENSPQNLSSRMHVSPKPVNDIVRIVGGYSCAIEQHPYMVSIHLTISSQHYCGGSLISAFWALTAAHCSIRYYEPGIFTVYAGSSLLLGKILTLKNLPIQTSLVDNIYVHKNYKRNVFPVLNDIALMKLDRPIHETRFVRYIKLARSSNILGRKMTDICTNSTIIGWGVQYEKDINNKALRERIPPHDDNLQCVNIPVISSEECGKIYKYAIPKNMVCAYKKGKDACQGDSGGPLVCEGLQFGVVSSGYGCAYKQYPGLYTRVDKYEDFIANILKGSAERSDCYRNINFYVFWFFILIGYS